MSACIATNPVHVDQWATYVTTPAPTTTSATVQVQTTVVNSGTASPSVSVQGIVSDPSGTQAGPGTAAAQTIAAGASASFTFDVTGGESQAMGPQDPNMYQLLTNVQVGGSHGRRRPHAVRDPQIKFNNGLTLNGKTLEVSGRSPTIRTITGSGWPRRSGPCSDGWRSSRLLGVNSIRTSHEPPSPDFLELTDRMGFLVLDEFTDVWTAHKYGDVGDYSMYFNKTSTTPTGMPAVPR